MNDLTGNVPSPPPPMPGPSRRPATWIHSYFWKAFALLTLGTIGWFGYQLTGAGERMTRVIANDAADGQREQQYLQSTSQLYSRHTAIVTLRTSNRNIDLIPIRGSMVSGSLWFVGPKFVIVYVHDPATVPDGQVIIPWEAIETLKIYQ